MSHTIIGFFDDRDQAEKARSELLMIAGLNDRDIHLFSNGQAVSDTDQYSSDRFGSSIREESFVDRIKHFFGRLGDDHRDIDIYSEGIRRGGVTLAITADDSESDHVSDVLNKFGAVDIDTRGEFYREKGFSRFDANAAPFSTDQNLENRREFSQWEQSRFNNKKADQSIDEVFPMIEEDKNISKRAVEKGRARIYTRAAEAPANQDDRTDADGLKTNEQFMDKRKLSKEPNRDDNRFNR